MDEILLDRPTSWKYIARLIKARKTEGISTSITVVSGYRNSLN